MKIAILASVIMAAATPVAAQTQTQMNAQAGGDWKTADAAMTAQWRRT